MPNWCENELRVLGKASEVKRFMAFVDGSRSDDTPLDFNHIVPYPDEYAARDAAHKKWQEDNEGVPWTERPPRPEDGYNSGGYEWCCANWGTKWNASNAAVRQTTRGCTYYFNTAWSPPCAVVRRAASLFPSLTFKLKYWEGGCGFQGSLAVTGDAIEEEWEGDYRGNKGG